MAANLSVSSPSRPRVLTTIAPSNDSWATSLSSARSACIRVNSGEESFWKIRFAMMTSGNTISPTSAMVRSTSSICATAITIIAMVPTAIGSGAIGAHAASTSLLALDSSWPVGCRWCHDIGSAR